MSVSLIASNSVDQASGTTITLTHGFTIAPGDVLVAVINSNAATGNPSDNNGSNQFQVCDGAANPDSAWASIWQRVAGASEPATYSWTVTNNRCALILLQMRGVHASVWDVAPAAASRVVTATGAASVPTPSMTVLTAGAYGLAIATDDYLPTTRVFSAVDSSYSLIREESGQQWVGVCGRSGMSTGASGTTTVTLSGVTSAVGWQVALKPSAVTVIPNLPAIVPQLPDVDTCIEYAYDGSTAEARTTDRITVVAGKPYTVGPYAQAFNVDGATCQLDALLYDTDIAYVPGIVTDGLVAHCQAERALLGTGPGVNSPLTTAWKNLVSGGTDGTLQTFAGTASSGYAGTGSVADPYRLQFDVASDRVDIAHLGVCADKSFTFEAWVRLAAKPAAVAVIVHETANGAGAFYPMTMLRVNATGYLGFYMQDAAGAAVNRVRSVNICDGNWHHVAGVANGTQMGLYCDGSLSAVGFTNCPAGSMVGTGWSTIGCERYSNTPLYRSYFSDGIASVRIYDRGLSPAEVQQNYAAGPNAPYPGVYRVVPIATLDANADWERHAVAVTPVAPEDGLAMRLTFGPA